MSNFSTLMTFYIACWALVFRVKGCLTTSGTHWLLLLVLRRILCWRKLLLGLAYCSFPWWFLKLDSSLNGCICPLLTISYYCLTDSCCRAAAVAFSRVNSESSCSFIDKFSSSKPTTILSLIISFRRFRTDNADKTM